MEEKTYTLLNGKLVLASRAAVPVADRGFRFGDGVFETIRVVKSVPYQWEFHLQRLTQSLDAVAITPPEVDWAAQAKKLLQKNRLTHGFLRIAISRGVGSRGYMPFPPEMPCHWVMEILPELPMPRKPCRLWLSKRPRIPLVCLPVNSKLAHGLNNTLALLEANAAQCDDALQLTTEGFIAETASANIFWIRDNTLFTPPLDTGCLNGSTRDAIMRLSPLPLRAAMVGISELQQADAVFITNCRVGVWPVTSIEPLGYRFNAKHALVLQLERLLHADITRYTRKHRNRWERAS